MKNKIRVCIISQGDRFREWESSILRDLGNSEYAVLVLHLKIIGQARTKPPLAWQVYSRLDQSLFKPSPNALALADGNQFCDKTLSVSTFDDMDQGLIKDYQLDVALNFTELSPPQNLVSNFGFGIWNLLFSDPKTPRYAPPGAWELIHGKPEIGASLCCLAPGTDSTILDQTSVCTDWISYSRNANMIFWQAAPLIARNLRKLYEHGDLGYWGYKMGRTTSIPNNPAHASLKYPGAKTLIVHSLKTVFKKMGQLTKSWFYFNQWILLFNKGSEDQKFDLSQYKRILPPRDRFWADPFLIKRNGKYYLFIEELIYKNKLGHLAVMELDKEGNHTQPKTILKKDYHLSYPFLFEDKDNLYMIPETGGNRDIQLYKCIEFPYRWQLEKVLMREVVAVDTTIHKKDDTYWMFTNLKEHKGMSNNVELFLFSSKDLITDQWKPHPLNPIVTDVKKSRPAGKIFMEGPNLIRPSQNCSHHYGYGMTINTITQLDGDCFEEKTGRAITPHWDQDILCTHTFNSCDDLMISDAKIKRWHFF